jgi:hypothetical protein
MLEAALCLYVARLNYGKLIWSLVTHYYTIQLVGLTPNHDNINCSLVTLIHVSPF